MISLLIRLAYAAWLYPEVLPGDAEAYWREAGRLVAGTGLSLYWPPGLPTYLAIWRWGWGDDPGVAVAAALAVWVACFALLAHLSRGAAPRGRRWLLLGFSLYPTFIHQSVVPLSYLPVAALLLAALALGQASARGRILSGLCWGAMALLRPASLALLPAWLLNGARWKNWLTALLLSAIPLLLWQGYLQQRGAGVFLNYANSYNFFLGNQPETPDYRSWWLGSHYAPDSAQFRPYYARLDSIRALPRSQQDEAFRQMAWQHITQEPRRFARRVGHRFKVFWAYDVLAAGTLVAQHPTLARLWLGGDVLAYLLLMSLSLWALWRPGAWLPRQRLWLGLVLSYPVPYWLAFSHPSYHLPLLPVLALLALDRREHRATHGLRRWVGWSLSLIGLLAIQVEWTLDLLDRLAS